MDNSSVHAHRSWHAPIVSSHMCLWQDSNSQWTPRSIVSPFMAQPGQRSAVSCFYQLWLTGNSWAASTPCARETTGGRWRDTGAMEEGSVPHLGCYLSGHICSVLRPIKPAVYGRGQRWGWGWGLKKRRLKTIPTMFLALTSPQSPLRPPDCGDRDHALVTEIGRRIAAVTHDPRSAMFLRQRLSVAVQRGNALCVRGIFTNNVPCNQY